MKFPGKSISVPETRPASLDQAFLLSISTASAEPMFANWHAGRACVREQRVLHRFGLVTSLAWVLLPSTLHWLVLIKPEALNYLVRRFKSRSALMVNRALGRGGQVWEYGYACRAVFATEDLVALANGILGGPIEAGLVADVGDYPLWDAWWVGSDDVASPVSTSWHCSPAGCGR